jgi:hypothetical protein
MLLLDADIEIDATNLRGQTALSVAAENGCVEAMCALIDDGADVALRAGKEALNWTPLMFAASKGHAEALGTSLTGYHGMPPSTCSALLSWCDLHLVPPCRTAVLLNADEGVLDLTDREGHTALEIAHLQGHQDAEDILFVAGDARHMVQVQQKKKAAATGRKAFQRSVNKLAFITRAKRFSRSKEPAEEQQRSSEGAAKMSSPLRRLQGGFKSVVRAGALISKLSDSVARRSSSFDSSRMHRIRTESEKPDSPLQRGLSRLFSSTHGSFRVRQGLQVQEPDIKQAV